MELIPWIVGIVAGLAIGYGVRVSIAKRLQNSLEKKAEAELESAKSEAKEIVVEAKDKASSILENANKEERDRKQELRQLEERLLKREDLLDQKLRELDNGEKSLKSKENEIKEKENDVEHLRERAVGELEKVSGLTREEARKAMFEEIETSAKQDLATSLAKLEREREEEIEKKANEIITTAIQRYSRNAIADVTTSVVGLPDEDIKAKIIGKEGRNIRAFERLTGVEVIVDETPENVVLSSFDPMRRELAKMALEKLIKDGRIHPAKIEEKVEEARQELEQRIQKIGEEAAYEVGILDLPKEIVNLLGRLNFRTSYGQNVLLHSVEMAHIAGMMATELHLNVDVAKKGALLHDIGKAVDHEVEGTHVEIGRKLLKKYGIAENVIQAMESHHEEYPYATPESYLVAAADVISAARPGARRDTLEKYIKRLEDIEKAVGSFEGVKQSYAVSAGREVRVFVVPEKIDDFGALELAKKISNKIQSDVQYPGEIKVTVIREVRAVEYAR
ncbi:ribonuclease Y [Patescibacteria group bacterium]|nr:ribonuclease Y [Patescibacteria group bacterium]MCL5114306.1 ribonuclease Y [Patescibacteria group bacterium]